MQVELIRHCRMLIASDADKKRRKERVFSKASTRDFMTSKEHTKVAMCINK